MVDELFMLGVSNSEAWSRNDKKHLKMVKRMSLSFGPPFDPVKRIISPQKIMVPPQTDRPTSLHLEKRVPKQYPWGTIA